MATPEDELRKQLDVALGKRKGEQKDKKAQLGDSAGNSPIKTTVTGVGTRQFPEITEQPSQATSVAAGPATFEAVERAAVQAAETSRVPLASTIEGPPQATEAQSEQIFGERRPDVFGAFDSQGNRLGVQSNQRNQAASGVTGGAQTSDASGTGAASGGTFSVVGGSDPAAQLASLRETFGAPGGQRTGGGVAIARDSRTRERNARVRDPRRKLVEQLRRDVQAGRLAPRFAGQIAANLLGQQADIQVGRERLAAQSRIEAGRTALERAKIGSAEKIASQKLKETTLSGTLDRQSREAIAAQKASQEEAKLGLGVEKLTETQRANRAREEQNRQSLAQRGLIDIIGLEQAGSIADVESEQGRQKLAFDLVKGLSEGADPDATMNLLQQIAPELFTEE